MATAAKSNNSKPAPHGRVVGRYLMFGQIGSGGTATVHFGRLRGQGGFVRTVALKRLHAHLARDPYFVSLFLSEARLAARVSHPNVTSLLDVVCQEDGELLLVMDYVHGETLAGLLGLCRRREAAIAPRIATAIIVGALAGLHAAHEALGEDGRPLGLVHGDVSPHNVIVGLDGTPRMLDFGVARAGVASQGDRRVIGTLAYMAPERLRGTGFDRRSDVFSAGVLLWEMLAMRRLFSGCDGRTKRALAQLPPPSKYQPQIPRALDDVVLWALRSEANDRPEDAMAFARALESAVAPASNREIADWLQATAGARLRERAEELTRIERTSVPSLLAHEADVDDLPTTAATGKAGAPPPAGWPASLGQAGGDAAGREPDIEEPTLYDPDLIARSQGALSVSLASAEQIEQLESDKGAPTAATRPGRTTPVLPRLAGPPTEPALDVLPPRSQRLAAEVAGKVAPGAVVAAPAAVVMAAGHQNSDEQECDDSRRDTRIDKRYASTPGSPAASPPPIADDASMPLPRRPFERRGMVLGGMALAGITSLFWLLGRMSAPATAAQRDGTALARELAVAAAPAAPAVSLVASAAAAPVAQPVAAAPAAPPAPAVAAAPVAAAPAPAVAPEPASEPAPAPEPAAVATAPAPSVAAARRAAAQPVAPSAARPAAPSPRSVSASRASARGGDTRASDARAARARILALNDHALSAYDSLEPQRALEQLRLALRLCREVSLYQRELSALTHMNLGVVLAGAFKQRDLAVRHFREARALSPGLVPAVENGSPEIRAAFAEATRAGL